MKLKAPENSAFLDIDLDALTDHMVQITTVLDGIKAVVPQTMNTLYAKGCDIFNDDTSDFDEAVKVALQSDVVILVLGDKSGLTPDCTTGETRDSSSLKLPGVQEDLAKAIFTTGKPVIVVLITGRPYSLAMLSENANAILLAWLPGEEGGSAVAGVLFGDVNPGGKLPITFPRSVGQVPIFYSSKPAGTKSHWYMDYVTEKVTPLYPFGHGLSYTTFKYSDLSIERHQVVAGENVDVSLIVKNIGNVLGEEVTQLYVHDQYSSIPRPVKELKGYKRLPLEPGEAKRITFHLPVNQLAFYDLGSNLIVEAGKIKIIVGSSSDDISLCGEIEIMDDHKMTVNERVFVCPVSVEPVE